MKTVTVRNLVIGDGAPKIIVSLMGIDIATVKSEALAYREADFDILEWRVDHFGDVSSTDAVLEAARAIRDVIADKPLLFTFRSAKEGGEQALSVENYIALNRAAVDSSLVDMIDLELFTGIFLFCLIWGRFKKLLSVEARTDLTETRHRITTFLAESVDV